MKTCTLINKMRQHYNALTPARQKSFKRFYILLTLVILLFICALCAPYLMPYDPNLTNPLELNQTPSWIHWCGTDNLGRDTFSRVLAGAQSSLFPCTILVICELFLGSFLGIIAAYYGGVLDFILMRVTDILMSIPSLVLAMALAGALKGGMLVALCALGVTGWTFYARLARSAVLSLKHEPYILAARLNASSTCSIIFKEILINISGPLCVHAALQLGNTMVGIAGLSFLGIGVLPPQAEWGSMIAHAYSYLHVAPWNTLAPACALMVSVCSINYFADTLRDIMDVKQ